MDVYRDGNEDASSVAHPDKMGAVGGRFDDTDCAEGTRP